MVQVSSCSWSYVRPKCNPKNTEVLYVGPDPEIELPPVLDELAPLQRSIFHVWGTAEFGPPAG